MIERPPLRRISVTSSVMSYRLVGLNRIRPTFSWLTELSTFLATAFMMFERDIEEVVGDAFQFR